MFRIDPATGNRTVLGQYISYTAADLFEGLSVENSAKLLTFGTGRVTRVDRQTGTRTILSLYPNIGAGLALYQRGDVALLGTDGLLVPLGAGNQALGKVELATGNRTAVSGYGETGLIGSGPVFSWGSAIVVEDDLQVTVADSTGSLYRVNPATGDRSLLLAAAGSRIFQHMTRLPEGGYLASDQTTIYRITLSSGQIQAIPGAAFTRIDDMEAAPDGSVYVFDPQQLTLYRVDPATGNRTIISSSDPLNPVGTGVDFPSSTCAALALGIVSGGTTTAASPEWMMFD